MKEVYSKYWINARERIYGFSNYDKNLCDHIAQNVPNPGKLLEVAIGTGYPFADFFQKAGYDVYGIDISSDLVNRCSQLNPNIICKVGDAEALEFADNYFDCAYCFHSTWYFPHLNTAINEMIRVVRKRGHVFFDIQNRNNKNIEKGYKKRIFQTYGLGLIFKYSINIAKIILQRGTTDWSRSVYEVPTFPANIYELLKNAQITNFYIMVRNEDESLEIKKGVNSFEKFQRLIICIEK